MNRPTLLFTTSLVLFSLLFVGCVPPSAQPAQPEPEPIQVEPEPEEEPTTEIQLEEEPAPVPEPDPEPAPKEEKPAEQKTTELKPIEQLSEAKKRMQEQQSGSYSIGDATFEGVIISLEGQEYDRGIVRRANGKTYNFYGYVGFKRGDRATFQIDSNLHAVNLKKVEGEERESYRIGQP